MVVALPGTPIEEDAPLDHTYCVRQPRATWDVVISYRSIWVVALVVSRRTS